MSNFGRNLALWVIIALLLVVLFNLFQPGADTAYPLLSTSALALAAWAVRSSAAAG